MAASVDFIEYATEQVGDCGAVRYKKMFGEYMVYVNDKPIFLVCDDTVFVKTLPCLDALMSDAEKGYPYSPEKHPGVKEHYILDIDNTELARDVVKALEAVTPPPKPRKKKRP
jgi:TfoX/Sxy family transcriptional regulator of competence genes